MSGIRVTITCTNMSPLEIRQQCRELGTFNQLYASRQSAQMKMGFCQETISNWKCNDRINQITLIKLKGDMNS